jgi:hypothetical protein
MAYHSQSKNHFPKPSFNVSADGAIQLWSTPKSILANAARYRDGGKAETVKDRL